MLSSGSQNHTQVSGGDNHLADKLLALPPSAVQDSSCHCAVPTYNFCQTLIEVKN